MSKLKKLSKFMFGLILSMFALVLGANQSVLMANATNLPDAGVTASGDPTGSGAGNGGIATETGGREDGDPEFYQKEIEKRITKIRPMATPIDQISRHAKSVHSDSFVVKYYSTGTRPVKTTLTTAITKQSSGSSVTLDVEDANMFTIDDTIRVVGVKGITNEKGTAYDVASSRIPDLVLHVCGRDTNTNKPVVYAVNGNKDGDGQPIWLPAIPEGTTLIRMGKAGGELDVQTGRFNNLPTSEEQYCQNFMIQVEQSTFDQLAKKEVNWDFTDLEEDGIYDMKLAQENSYLFGAKGYIKHVTKDGMGTWFTGGVWYMAGKDIEIGHYDAESKTTVVSDDDLVDMTRDLFVGTGIGNKRKIMFCGSDVLAALSKIQSDKFRLKESVEHWNLKFKSWDTDFGEVLTIHHELFDLNGMSDYAFAMDPEYLTKRTHINWTRNVLDLKSAGVRNTNAVVLQEVSCIYLRYAKAHARMKLASAA